MRLVRIGEIYTINQEETMEKVKQVLTWAKANKQKSIIIVIVVIAIIALIK
jgi:hypothetical protein